MIMNVKPVNQVLKMTTTRFVSEIVHNANQVRTMYICNVLYSAISFATIVFEIALPNTSA